MLVKHFQHWYNMTQIFAYTFGIYQNIFYKVKDELSFKLGKESYSFPFEMWLGLRLRQME